MAIRPLRRPSLETLEDRACPALTIKVVGADVFISGTPVSPLGISVTGAMVGTTKFTIMDGTANLGTYSIGRNLSFSLPSYLAPITIDLQTQRIGGNVLLNFGTGNVSGTDQPVVIRDGSVGGSVTHSGGSGNESLFLGAPAGTEPVTVGGNVQFIGRNGSAGNSNELKIFDASRVGGTLTTSLASSVQIGESAGGGAFVGNVNVNANGARSELAFSINKSSIVGNVSIGGTNQFGGLLGDVVVVETLAEVRGTMSANLGDNVNFWQLGGTFLGNVSLSGGSGTEPGGVALHTIQLSNGADTGTFNGSVTATTGGGSTAFIFPTGATIGGQLSLTFGNGDNDLGGGVFGGVFQGTVAGNVNIRLGNGNNTAVIESAPGGRLFWRSGNGTDSLTLGSATTPPSSWLVDIAFGTGSDTFTLADTGGNAQLLSGMVNGGGGAFSFTQDDDWTLTNITFVNI